jgi:hypothetical protein
MAVRRKYKSPPQYRDGGAVPLAAEMVVEPTLAASSSSSAPSATAISAAHTPEESPLMRAVEATLRAEGLQREAARLQREAAQQSLPASAPAPAANIEQYVDRLPGLTDHKRTFLKAHPEMLDPVRAGLMSRHYADALKAGIDDDSAEMDRYVLQAVQSDVARLSRPSPPMEPQTAPAAPAPARRPSMPITAPVSRDIPMPNGERRSGSVKLSREECEIAHLSYRDLPPKDAERVYATQKLKLNRMRAAGQYPERERG